MNREQVLQLMNGGLSKDLIRAYCLEMGKPKHLVDLFITALVMTSKLQGTDMFDYCFGYAIDYYTNKFNIVFLSDKNGNFIKAF